MIILVGTKRFAKLVAQMRKQWASKHGECWSLIIPSRKKRRQ
jgi:hypothetical protein